MAKKFKLKKQCRFFSLKCMYESDIVRYHVILCIWQVTVKRKKSTSTQHSTAGVE